VPYQFESGLITLTIHSSLDAVGFLAAASAVLAEAGIPCNAVAAFHHDHLFVPRETGQRALDLLVAVAAAPAQLPAGQQSPSN
jgi:hypothetical protein